MINADDVPSVMPTECRVSSVQATTDKDGRSRPGLLHARTAVVTGAADGIGWATAERFAGDGARVVIADLRGDAAKARASELADAGIAAIGVQCDVTQERDVDALVAVATDSFGSIDILVNNAGVTRDAVLRKMTLEDFQTVIDVHLRGAWLCTRAAVAAMRAASIPGVIINMSSISGKVGNPGQTNYSAAKAGIVGLTKATAKEVARYGIRVNSIAPGLIRTAMAKQMNQAALESAVSNVPLGRIGEPEEVAEVALFLASEMSSYLTGCLIEVAGGRNI